MSLSTLPSYLSVVSGLTACPSDGPSESDMNCESDESTPQGITPENAHEFPGLVREIEEIERDYHQAKNPWSRGVVSLFILAHSGRFHDYVTRNGLLSDAGREFLSTLEGSQREIDPAVVQQDDHTDKADGGVVPKKEMPALAPLQAASENTSVSESELRDMESALASVPSFISPGYTTIANIPVDPAQIPAAIAFLSNRDGSMRMRAVHFLTSAAINRHDISAALPLLNRMIDETMPFGATVTKAFWAPATEAIKAAREHEASSAQAYDLLIDMLGRSAENEWKRANAVFFGDFLHVSASEQRDRALAALRRAEHHRDELVQRRAGGLLSQYEEIALRELIALLKLYDFSPVDLAAGPGRLAERLQAEPELIPLAVKLLDSHESRMVEAVSSAFGIVAAADGDVTPAIGRMFDLCFSDRFSRGPETSIVQRAFGNLIHGTKTRKAALDLIEPKLAESRLTERSAAYSILRVSARGQRAMDMLARGLGDETYDIRNNVREALKLLAADPRTSMKALYATADMLIPKYRPECRNYAAQIFEHAAGFVDIVAAESLVAAMQEGTVAVVVHRALIKAAMREGSRKDVLAALMRGIASDDATVRSNSASILGRLVAREKSRAATLDALAAAHTSEDVRVRSGIALAYGHAAKSAALGQTEIDILEKLRTDGDKAVQDNAAWALKNARANGGSDVTTGAAPHANLRSPSPLPCLPAGRLSPPFDIAQGTARERVAETPQHPLEAGRPPAEAAGDRQIETPQLDEPELKQLFSLRDTSIWDKARPEVLRALLELDAERRHGLMKASLETDDYYSPKRAAGLYAEFASQIPLARQEIEMLFRKRRGAWSDLANLLKSALDAARKSRGRDGFLSRDAYFEVMGRAVNGEFGEAAANTARELLRTAANNPIGPDGRAADLLAGAERGADVMPAQDTTGPKADAPAPTQKANPLLDPASLVEVFRNSYEDRHDVAGIATSVAELLALARTGRDKTVEVTSAMWQAVKLAKDDMRTLEKMVYFFFSVFNREGLLSTDDYAKLLELLDRHVNNSTVFNTVYSIIYDAKCSSNPLLKAAEASREQAQTSAVQQASGERARQTPANASAADKPAASPKDAPRVDPPSPEQLAFIKKMVERILRGDQKAAVADWAKLVGEGKAETHALPILLEVAAAVNDRSMAVDRLANAIAKDTNNPGKKLGILMKALSSEEPRVRAGAALILGELGRISDKLCNDNVRPLLSMLSENEDDKVRIRAEEALIAIGKNPGYRALVVAEVSMTAEAVKGKKLASLERILKAI